MPTTKRKAPKARKDEFIRVRILGSHKRLLEAAAEREGLDLSTWIRQLALRAAGILPDAK